MNHLQAHELGVTERGIDDDVWLSSEIVAVHVDVLIIIWPHCLQYDLRLWAFIVHQLSSCCMHLICYYQLTIVENVMWCIWQSVPVNLDRSCEQQILLVMFRDSEGLHTAVNHSDRLDVLMAKGIWFQNAKWYTKHRPHEY
jgi:hypothetical protein